MGCDIHGMYEVKVNKWGQDWWINAGSFDPGRNYNLFAILGNVRNYENVPYIGAERLKRAEALEDCSDEFQSLLRSWGDDAHSASFVTLDELIDYYEKHKNAEVYNSRLVLSRNPDGSIKETCGGTNHEHLGPVGMCSVFGEFGDDYFTDITEEAKKRKEFFNAKDIRIVFFFDN